MSCEFKVGDIVVLKETQPNNNDYYSYKKNIKFRIKKIYKGFRDYLIAGESLCGSEFVDAYAYRFEFVKSESNKPIKWV